MRSVLWNHDDRGAVPLGVLVTMLFDGNIRRHLTTHQLGVERPLDLRYLRALGARGKSGCRSSGSGAPRTSGSMNEVLRNLRKIVVHHMSDAFDVNAA